MVSSAIDQVHSIHPDKRRAVLETLDGIESVRGVKVLYACESGSRGWGFSSPDSDYDGRFIYMHPLDWYLTVNERTGPNQPQRDVIEVPIDNDLDVSGWDLRKALRLLSKANPTLLEWLRSPVVYRQNQHVADGLRDLAERHYSPMAAWHHYLSMAKGNYRGYLCGARIRTKKYLYVLRPILACMWIERFDTPPPMSFILLLDPLMPDGSIRRAIDELLEVKRSSLEVADGPPIPEISRFLDVALQQRLGCSPQLRGSGGRQSELDQFFRQTLQVISSE